MAFGIASIQAGFIDDLYREHNNYRRQNGLSPLKTDSTIEYYLKQLGSVSYAVGHNHDQIPNLEGKLKLFDGNPGVIITIGCVTNDRLRESPPPGKCKHNVLVVFDC